jgi:hypothetical protein
MKNKTEFENRLDKISKDWYTVYIN